MKLPTKRATALSLLLVSFLLLPGCVGTLVQFIVPQTIMAGSTFELVVVGSNTGGSSGEYLGAVVQIPAGFSVLGAITDNRDTGGIILPVLLNQSGFAGMYAAEPGNVLAYFSATASGSVSNPIVLRIRVLAPLAGGAYTFKVAIAGQSGAVWQAQDPVGVTSFANITDAAHAIQTTVISTPSASLIQWTEVTQGLPNYDTGNWTGVAFADVNSDGRQDLGCIARTGNGPHVLLNVNATQSQWQDSSNGLLGSSGRSDVAFGDFNGDHVPDLADGNGRCFLRNAMGAWTPASTGLNVSFGPEGVAVGDVNGDGLDDVAFSGHFSPNIRFFFSNGNGTWSESSLGLPTAQPPGTGTAGGHKLLMKDVNGDGFLDIVWCRIQAAGIWLGNGAGAWTEVAGSGLEPYQFWGVDAADLDGDGDTDLVFGAFNDPANPNLPLGIRLYRKQPGLTWTYDPNSGLPTSGAYGDVAIADFDRDGLLDVVAGRNSPVTSGIEIWRGVPGGTFTAAPFVSGLPNAGLTAVEGIAVGDFNDDTFPDIAAACYGLGVYVFRNEMTGFSVFGQGCHGASPFQPVMGSSGGPPNIGNSAFTMTMTGGKPSSIATLVAGLSRTYFGVSPILPLSLAPYGASGCSLLVDPLVLFDVAVNGAGSASLGTPIPNDPALLQLVFYAQWVNWNQAANPLGVALSQGVAIRVGP